MVKVKNVKKIRAIWDIRLWSDCPLCKESIDLLDYADFWDGRTIEICEQDTEKTRGMEVVCPECSHEFEVDCEY